MKNDLIKRQMAIDALDDFILDEVTDLHGDSVREILERLSSAQPKRKSTCANCKEFDCYGCDAKMEVNE